MRICDLVLNFIQNLNERLSKKPFVGNQKEHLEYFFNQILGGRINIDWEYSRRKIEFVENEIITPIERSASMVQELSSIPLLLSGSGPDEIIIEEPEAHLHPIAQLEFVKWLVMYINYETTLNRNVNVILTSHSPIITAQLDNILVATELLGNRTNKIFNETQLISKEVVNMYLLKQDDDGFILDLNPIDRGGFDRDVFAEVNKLLYEEYGEIIELSNEE